MKIVSFLMLASISLVALADDEAAITPYRPSVSSPAQLPVAGQLELELGYLRSKADGLQRDSLPVQLKLGFSQEWGVLLGAEAHVSMQNLDRSRDQGIGDTTVVLKRAFIVDDATAYGAEFGIKIPTANDVIGSGKSDYVVNAIYSKDVAKLHIDANINLTRLGAYEAGAGRMQTGVSSSFSLPLAERWGATAELSGVQRSGVASTAQVLLATSFSPNKRMTIDFGFAKGLNHASQDWSIFSGVVVPLVKFW